MIQKWLDNHVAPHLIRCACTQPGIMKERAKIIPLAQGDVFELGCGGGINLSLYDPAKLNSFSGCDPTPMLLDDSRRKVRERGINADIREGVGEDIPFASDSFDTVVTTFTLCSVQDPARVLAEIRRVLRPGGMALFLEHGRAPEASVQKWQRRLEPMWKRLAGGCHLTRPIADAYSAAGFATDRMGQRYVPKTPRPVGWIEWGVAR